MADRAAELVQSGMAVGLGTGRAASAFLVALADRVRRGLDVRCVATSVATESAARDLGLPLASLEEVGELDLDVDGADEVDPALASGSGVCCRSRWSRSERRGVRGGSPS